MPEATVEDSLASEAPHYDLALGSTLGVEDSSRRLQELPSRALEDVSDVELLVVDLLAVAGPGSAETLPLRAETLLLDGSHRRDVASCRMFK